MGKTPESMVKPAKVTYEERLLKLGYSFQEDPLLTTELALRFALSIPGVHTVMVGTTKPDRWLDNYALASKGNLARNNIRPFESAGRNGWTRNGSRFHNTNSKKGVA